MTFDRRIEDTVAIHTRSPPVKSLIVTRLYMKTMEGQRMAAAASEERRWKAPKVKALSTEGDLE